MNNLFFFILIIFALLLEGTHTSIPLVLDVLLVFYIFKRKSRIFIPAFIAGIFLDIFGVRNLGLSSIFFIVFIFFIFLYGRKFETQTFPFVGIASFLGGVLYLWIFGHDYVFLQSAASSIIAVLLFGMLNSINTTKIQKLKFKITSKKSKLRKFFNFDLYLCLLIFDF